MGYINKEELSQELIDYLKSGSDGGNIDLEKTDNIKYNTLNGSREFTCAQDGYIDNVNINGKTMVNLMTNPWSWSLTESNGNLWDSIDGGTDDPVYSYSNGVYTHTNTVGTNTDFGQVISVKPNTVYTFSINVVSTGGSNVQMKMGMYNSYPVIDVSNANADIWEGVQSTTKVNVATRLKYTFTTSATCTYAIFTIQCENADTIFKFSEPMVLEGDYSNIEVPFFTGVKSVGQDDMIKMCTLDSASKIKDEKHIPECLRSLPNGVCDNIKYVDGRYIKTQNCNEVILTGKNCHAAISGVDNQTNTIAFNVQLHGITITGITTVAGDLTVYSDRFKTLDKTKETEDVEGICQGGGSSQNYLRIRIQRSRLSEESVKGFKEWLDANPTTIVYQLKTPLYIEVPNFNTRVFKGNNNLFINSGVVQVDCSFEVTTSLGSELEVLKNNSDDYNLVIADMQKTIKELTDRLNDICSPSYPYEYLSGEYFHKSNNGQTFLNQTGVDLDTIKENMFTQTTSAMALVNLPFEESGGAGIFECKVVYSANSKRHVIQKFINTSYNIEYTRTCNFDNGNWAAWEVTAGNSYCTGSKSDFNNFVTQGSFYITGTTNGVTNAPVAENTGWFLEVSTRRDGKFIYQKAMQVVNNDTYIPKYDRYYYNGTWNAWRYL